jgi:hypothetical protein
MSTAICWTRRCTIGTLLLNVLRVSVMRSGWLTAATSVLLAATLNAQTISPLSHGALAEILAKASAQNRLPPDLISYKANVETEVAVLLRQEDGIETVGQLEQVASTLRWTRAGKYDQHVVGYRSQEMGVSLSALSALREGWLIPVLYGNRLRARVDPSDRTDQSPLTRRLRGGRRTQRADSIVIVHPLAVDRDNYYVYSQGDTLVTLQSGSRSIPIVRVHVEPRADINDSVAIFVGDMDLDVTRGTLVKLRGYFARAGKARHHGFALTLADAIGFVEFQNGEYNGKYWLPSVQRVELQAMLPVLGDGRAVIRIVSRFPQIAVNDTVIDAASIARADSLRAYTRRQLTYATNDSVSHFSRWLYPLGVITRGMRASDFDDIAPDRMRTTGAPRLDVAAPRVSDVLHFDRVEGWYTGLGLKLALRDKAPGVTLRANAGWAWSEQTVRGRVSAERKSGDWIIAARAGRSLDVTNDFRNPVDSGPFISFGSNDGYDYVDRKSVTLGVSRLMLNRHAIVRAEYGYADDRYAATTVVHGLISNTPFLPDRGVDGGGYRRTIAVAEWHPELNLESIVSGVTARGFYERGDGTLSYQRAEARLITRHQLGRFTLVARGDVGEVFGNTLPPQQLFELDNGANLPGYKVKEFAGSRAAAFRTNLLYTSQYLHQPVRVTSRFWLPGIAPGLSIGVQSGWTDAPSSAARASILRLGFIPDSTGALYPAARVSDGVRASMTAGLRFFSGSVFVGAARALDQHSPWRFRFSTGTAF